MTQSVPVPRHNTGGLKVGDSWQPTPAGAGTAAVTTFAGAQHALTAGASAHTHSRVAGPPGYQLDAVAEQQPFRITSMPGEQVAVWTCQ